MGIFIITIFYLFIYSFFFLGGGGGGGGFFSNRAKICQTTGFVCFAKTFPLYTRFV